MDYAGGKQSDRHTLAYRPVAEKMRIVELTFQPGSSVAKVTQPEGVNSRLSWHTAVMVVVALPDLDQLDAEALRALLIDRQNKLTE
jgi:hypothetical protein